MTDKNNNEQSQRAPFVNSADLLPVVVRPGVEEDTNNEWDNGYRHPGEEDARKARRAARERYKAMKERRILLKELANMIGGELVEYVDNFGIAHTYSRDELIIAKFAERVVNNPTPANVLAWQKIKGEDVQQFQRTDVIESRDTSEIRDELARTLAALTAGGINIAGINTPTDTSSTHKGRQGEPEPITPAEPLTAEEAQDIEQRERDSRRHYYATDPHRHGPARQERERMNKIRRAEDLRKMEEETEWEEVTAYEVAKKHDTPPDDVKLPWQ